MTKVAGAVILTTVNRTVIVVRVEDEKFGERYCSNFTVFFFNESILIFAKNKLIFGCSSYARYDVTRFIFLLFFIGKTLSSVKYHIHTAQYIPLLCFYTFTEFLLVLPKAAFTHCD